MIAEPELPFAAMVRQGLREKGLGLRELCRLVRLDPSFFSKVLAGKRSPPAEEAALRRIAACLGLDAPRLIVAAGRIPREWRKLWTDGALFDSVHRMAAPGQAPPHLSVPAASAMRKKPPSGARTQAKLADVARSFAPMEEELL